MLNLLLSGNVNIINIIIPVAAVLIVTAVALFSIINKKKGKSGCGCGCDCSKCSGCASRNETEKK
jgi:hypothetical protein